MPRPILALSLALVPLLGGCELLLAAAERQAMLSAHYELDRAELVKLDLPLSMDAGVDLKLVLKVTNPNRITARLDRLDYDLAVEGTRVGTGSVTQDFAVAAGASQELTLPVTLKYLNLPGPALAAVQQRGATFALSGTSHLSGAWGQFDFPVAVSKLLTF